MKMEMLSVNRSSQGITPEPGAQLLRIGLLLAVSCLLSIPLLGQVHLISSDKKPKDPAPNTWWWSSEAHTLKRFTGEKWHYAHSPDEMPQDVRVYQGLVIAKLFSHYRIYTMDGSILSMACDTFIGYDSLVCARWRNADVLIDARVKPDVENRVRSLDGVQMELKPQQVAGQTAFCILDNLDQLPYWVTQETARFWGLLGSNGQWIIPPMFDEPFTFKNGVATVVKYGVVYRINEQGEFLP